MMPMEQATARTAIRAAAAMILFAQVILFEQDVNTAGLAPEDSLSCEFELCCLIFISLTFSLHQYRATAQASTLTQVVRAYGWVCFAPI
jgi:phosphopantothenate synthetase